MNENWNCPFCNRQQLAAIQNTDHLSKLLKVKNNSEGDIGYIILARTCLNWECKRTTVSMQFGKVSPNQVGGFGAMPKSGIIFDQTIVPQGFAKLFPVFIPEPLREDYSEACLIRDLSPKASATLTRRCLQGMIRDFAGISKSRLTDEIDALRKSVIDGSADRSITPETVEAIDHVRSVGNIGAHMERDIDHIVPVDPGEAQALINLVEMLFEEWYVAREKRKERLTEIAGIADNKKARKASTAAPSPDQNPL